MMAPGVAGHERALRVLERALSSGRTAHAYLFWGPDGVGKERVALALAKTLLCADPQALSRAAPCGVCPSCAKCDAGQHPDLHLVAPGDKAISVEDVRALQEKLAFRAYERGRKIAIIRDAFRMSASGANALLKTVEEPPADTHLVLIAHHRGQLLPTLVSRCQPIRFDPLSEAEVFNLLAERGVGEDAARRLAAVSGGSPGFALATEPDAVIAMEAEAERVADTLPRMGVGERFALAERLAKEDRAAQGLFLQCLERSLLSRARRDDAALSRLERLHELRAQLDRNANAQLALDVFFVMGGEKISV